MFKVGLFLICFLQRHRVAPNSKDRTGDQASGIGMAARVQASRLGLFPPPLRATSSYDGRGRVPLNFELDTDSTTCPGGSPKKAAERSALRCRKAHSVSRRQEHRDARPPGLAAADGG
jgi:hypothetical protein